MADWTSNPGREPGITKKGGDSSGFISTWRDKATVRVVSIDGQNESKTRNLSGLSLSLKDGQPLVTAPRKHFDLAAKRVMDIALSLCLLLFFAPFLCLIAVAIKLNNPGPVLFRQTREGLHGTTFNIYKFRTMHHDQCDPSGINQTQANDCRITGLGLYLRKTSIDELPQLINVLKGDMSLVGPRPHAVGMLAAGRRYCDLLPYYRQRLIMKPGLTGWAQANGLRGPTVNAERAAARIDHDLAYIANYSIWLDIKIIVLTLRHEVFGGNGF